MLILIRLPSLTAEWPVRLSFDSSTLRQTNCEHYQSYTLPVEAIWVVESVKTNLLLQLVSLSFKCLPPASLPFTRLSIHHKASGEAISENSHFKLLGLSIYFSFNYSLPIYLAISSLVTFFSKNSQIFFKLIFYF